MEVPAKVVRRPTEIVDVMPRGAEAPAAPGRLFLIDPLTTGPLDAFWKLVIDPARIVVVHAGREEVRLCRLWGGSAPGNLFDLQLAAGLAGLGYPLSHGALVQQVLGVR